MNPLKQVLTAKGSNWAICLLSGSMIAVSVSNWTRPGPVSAQAGAPGPRKMTGESKVVSNALQDAFVSIADTVEPTVVTIVAKSAQPDKPSAPDGEKSQPDFPRDFFRLPKPDGGDDEPRGGASTGSGVMIRESGSTVYVLTNNHVVNHRDRFRVELNNHSDFNAELVGTDPRTDLAILKFQTRRPLPAGSIAKLGDSDEVKVGQWAIAIGSPLGYDSTLTVGVVSAKGRSLDSFGARSSANYVDLIQTDASINPGNSGGPLVNIGGEVMGINVAIASSGQSQGNIGIGFAIPINTAKMVADQLLTKGKVVRGYLGVTVSQQNRELSDELKDYLKADQGGALVEGVAAETPASRAGVKDGDVIVKFGPRPVHNFTDLEKAVAATRPGDAVPVEVIRDGKPTRLSITVMERPSDTDLEKSRVGTPFAPERAPAAPAAGTRTKYGLSVRPSTGVKGAEVAAVAPGSPAQEAGIFPGDVITEVAGKPVNNVESLQQALGAAPADGFVIRVASKSGLRFVVVRP